MVIIAITTNEAYMLSEIIPFCIAINATTNSTAPLLFIPHPTMYNFLQPILPKNPEASVPNILPDIARIVVIIIKPQLPFM